MPDSAPSAGIATADTCPSAPAASAAPAATAARSKDSCLTRSELFTIAFSKLVSKLYMNREVMRQIYQPSALADAAETRSLGGISIEGKIDESVALMDEFAAAWCGRPSRQELETAETAAARAKITAMNRDKLKLANAAKAVSGNKGGRPRKERS